VAFERSGLEALARDIVLYSWEDNLLSQCLSPPRCINIMGTSNLNSGVTLRWTSISSATSNSVHKFLSCLIIPLK